jgi:hypothetical protein
VIYGHSREIGDGYNITTITWIQRINNWRSGGNWKNRFLLGNWWVQQGATLGAHFLHVSVKDHTVSSDVASLKVPNT